MTTPTPFHSSRQPLRLLLVDDEPGVLAALQRMFKPAGYQLHSASNGAEAMAILAKHSVDVVLSDNKMPGISGADLVKYIRQFYPRVITMMLSGQSEFDIVVELLNQGLIDKFVTKPWNNANLINEVEQAAAFLRQRQNVEHSVEQRRLALTSSKVVPLRKPAELNVADDASDDNRYARESRWQRMMTQPMGLCFNPRVSLASGLITAAELWLALPQQGVVPVTTAQPTTLGHMDEESEALSDALLRASIRLASLFSRNHPTLEYLSVPVATVHWLRPSLLATLQEEMQRYNLAADKLWLEIDERLLSINADSISHTLWQLRAMGIRLVVNDFGRGYSALSRLALLPIDALKLDNSLIENVDKDVYQQARLDNIVQTCKRMKIDVIANNVAYAEILKPLRKAGVVQAQGPVYGVPMRQARFEFAMLQQPYQRKRL